MCRWCGGEGWDGGDEVGGLWGGGLNGENGMGLGRFIHFILSHISPFFF